MLELCLFGELFCEQGKHFFPQFHSWQNKFFWIKMETDIVEKETKLSK